MNDNKSNDLDGAAHLAAQEMRRYENREDNREVKPCKRCPDRERCMASYVPECDIFIELNKENINYLLQ